MLVLLHDKHKLFFQIVFSHQKTNPTSNIIILGLVSCDDGQDDDGGGLGVTSDDKGDKEK